MRVHVKYVSAITVFAILLILYTSSFSSGPWTAVGVKSKPISSAKDVAAAAARADANDVVSIWISVTKIGRGHLLPKFRKFFESLVGRRGGRCRAVFQLNVITDNASRPTVDGVVNEFDKRYDAALLEVKQSCERSSSCVSIHFVVFRVTVFSWFITISKTC